MLVLMQLFYTLEQIYKIISFVIIRFKLTVHEGQTPKQHVVNCCTIAQ